MLYLFCGILGGAVLGAICLPLFKKEETLESAIMEETEWDLLQRKKEVVLGNIQDLDFEYKCGKLSDEDYQKIRAEMSAEAAGVFQEIENIEADSDLDALIRREIGARKDRPKTSASAAARCESCGASNPAHNKFCAECGAKLKAR
jgi:NADH pyrophosphatase NudC (nudix superfamily)